MKLEKVIIEFEAARKGLTQARIIRKSKERDRLPTSEELQLLTDYFYKRWRRLRNTIPMHLIIWYAIYTCRRQDELCSLLLTDYDEANQQWKLRDLKHPDGSEGNNKFGHLEPLAIDLIPEFLKLDVRDAIAIAEKHYDDYYSEWRTKKRYLSQMDKS